MNLGALDGCAVKTCQMSWPHRNWPARFDRTSKRKGPGQSKRNWKPRKWNRQRNRKNWSPKFQPTWKSVVLNTIKNWQKPTNEFDKNHFYEKKKQKHKNKKRIKNKKKLIKKKTRVSSEKQRPEICPEWCIDWVHRVMNTSQVHEATSTSIINRYLLISGEHKQAAIAPNLSEKPTQTTHVWSKNASNAENIIARHINMPVRQSQ